jgi:hypothetical protein
MWLVNGLAHMLDTHRMISYLFFIYTMNVFSPILVHVGSMALYFYYHDNKIGINQSIYMCRYYGGGSRDESRAAARRREREERDNMVRDFIRNGRGWSQPNNIGGTGTAAAGDRSRKLPKTPANSLNAMGVLQSMLGLNQVNLGSLATLNSSVPNLAVNQTIGMANNVVNAVRRLPQVPNVDQDQNGSGGSVWSRLFGRKGSQQQQQQQQQQRQQQAVLNPQLLQQQSQHHQQTSLINGPSILPQMTGQQQQQQLMDLQANSQLFGALPQQPNLMAATQQLLSQQRLMEQQQQQHPAHLQQLSGQLLDGGLAGAHLLPGDHHPLALQPGMLAADHHMSVVGQTGLLGPDPLTLQQQQQQQQLLLQQSQGLLPVSSKAILNAITVF